VLPGEMDDTLALIKKKLKKRNKGKDDTDGAVAECDTEGEVLVQQEDVQGVVDTDEEAVDEKSSHDVVKVEVQGLDDLRLQDSLSVLFTRSARKSRQVLEKGTEGVDLACPHDEEGLVKESALDLDTTSKGTKRRRRRTKEEMMNASAHDRKVSLPRKAKAKANASDYNRCSRVDACQAEGELTSVSPELQNKSDGKENAADDGSCNLSFGEAHRQGVEASIVLRDGSGNSFEHTTHHFEVSAWASNQPMLKPCSRVLAVKASSTTSDDIIGGVSDAHTCSHILGKDSTNDIDCSQGKSPTSTIKRKTGLKPKQLVPRKPVQRNEVQSSIDAKPSESKDDVLSKYLVKSEVQLSQSITMQSNTIAINMAGCTGEPKGGETERNAAVHTEENLGQVAPATDVDMVDVAAPLGFEDTENSSKLKRVLRSSKKRKHGDMAYEGDADWETLMQAQGLFSNPSGGFVDQSVKTKDKTRVSEVYESGGDNGAAAVRAGLKAKAIVPIEKLKFKEILKRKGGLQEYLECR
jgi:hypothetical protein